MKNYYNKPAKDWTERELTYPEFYHGDDINWIFSQLDRLSDENRKKASKEYREWYLKKGRSKANGLLKMFCEKFGTNEIFMKSKPEVQVYDNPLQSRIDSIRKNGVKRPTILGMAGEE